MCLGKQEWIWVPSCAPWPCWQHRAQAALGHFCLLWAAAAGVCLHLSPGLESTAGTRAQQMAKCSFCPSHGQPSPKATRTSLEVCSELETALLKGQVTIQSETLSKRALPLQAMCIRRDEPEGVCGGGGGEIQWDESEGKAAQAQGLSPGKVPELGWSQLAWKALGMEMVSQGQQEGAGRAAWVRSWGNTGRAVPAWSVPWDCRQAPSQGMRLPWRSTESLVLLIPPWGFMDVVRSQSGSTALGHDLRGET